eukprot:10757202-Heterocapsa_arctica.AAC.1
MAHLVEGLLDIQTSQAEAKTPSVVQHQCLPDRLHHCAHRIAFREANCFHWGSRHGLVDDPGRASQIWACQSWHRAAMMGDAQLPVYSVAS